MAKSKEKENKGPATIQNRKARYDFEILQNFEAGLVLVGSEVKSLFQGRANLTDSFCQIKAGEIWLLNVDIEPYSFSAHFAPERRRDRKLLMHKKEIELIDRRSKEKGFTIIPLKIYFSHGKAKVEIALARGKRQYDKREKISERDTRNERDQALKKFVR